jgi:hypothetical protein
MASTVMASGPRPRLRRAEIQRIAENAPRKPDLTALCRRAVAALTEAGALQRPMRSLRSRITKGAALLNMAVEPLAMCYPSLVEAH